jgi:NAD(P)-dependent dehydrogenase (short-subunit alcohol dehydrogenase family)
MFAVHVRGTFLCYKYAVQQMIRQGRGGRIVGASSVLGRQGLPYAAHYSAAKFAIRGLTQAVGTSMFVFSISRQLTFNGTAQEVGKHGITVNTYAPGMSFTRNATCSHDAIFQV